MAPPWSRAGAGLINFRNVPSGYNAGGGGVGLLTDAPLARQLVGTALVVDTLSII